MEKYFSLMSLFLCLSRISYCDIVKEMSKVGVSEKVKPNNLESQILYQTTRYNFDVKVLLYLN